MICPRVSNRGGRGPIDEDGVLAQVRRGGLVGRWSAAAVWRWDPSSGKVSARSRGSESPGGGRLAPQPRRRPWVCPGRSTVVRCRA